MRFLSFLLLICWICTNAQTNLMFHSKKGNCFEYIHVDSISISTDENLRHIQNIYIYDNCLPVLMETIDSVSFLETNESRNWGEIMTFPSRDIIDNYNISSTQRSPYIWAWLATNVVQNYTQYAIDFKADYLPPATYCSMANFYLDYSSLYDKYAEVTVEGGGKSGGIYGYAGLQRQYTNINKYNAILSLWQIYCKKDNGETDTIRAKLIKPVGEHENHFSHEGCGVNYLPKYNWKSNHWYRLLLQCGVSSETFNTTLEFWVCELENRIWKQVCVYDLGAPNVSFTGKSCVFLENFSAKYSGEIRTLEFKNVRIFNRENGGWIPVKSGNFGQQANYPGCYHFGSDNSTFYMITSGVSNCSVNPENTTFHVIESETGSPF